MQPWGIYFLPPARFDSALLLLTNVAATFRNARSTTALWLGRSQVTDGCLIIRKGIHDARCDTMTRALYPSSCSCHHFAMVCQREWHTSSTTAENGSTWYPSLDPHQCTTSQLGITSKVVITIGSYSVLDIYPSRGIGIPTATCLYVCTPPKLFSCKQPKYLVHPLDFCLAANHGHSIF